ncbi:hypothetical protein AA313_de0200014 [Arthrobotrys entomopaga]|nr:hypothetical protein AA313_de0200014 [Arthrobotrys entomopaga]
MGAKCSDPINHTRCVGKATSHYGTTPDPDHDEEAPSCNEIPITKKLKSSGIRSKQRKRDEDEKLRAATSEILAESMSVWAYGEPQSELERFKLNFGYIDGAAHWYLAPPSEPASIDDQPKEQQRTQKEEETWEEIDRKWRESQLPHQTLTPLELMRQGRDEIWGEGVDTFIAEYIYNELEKPVDQKPKTPPNVFPDALCTMDPEFMGFIMPEYSVRESPIPEGQQEIVPEPEPTWKGYVAKDKEGRAIVDYLIRQGHPAPIPCDGQGICTVGTTRHFHNHERERTRATAKCGLVGNNRPNRDLLNWFEIPLSKDHLEAVYYAREFGDVELLVDIYLEWNPDRPIVALPPIFPTALPPALSRPI